MSDATATPTADRARRGGRALWPLLALFVGFGLLYAWDLVEAITNTVRTVTEITAQRQVEDAFLRGLGVDPAEYDLPDSANVPWSALILNMLAPVLAYTGALLLGRRRVLWQRALLLLTGLAVVAVVTLSLTAYVRAGGL